jgi:hypothetical protein
VLTFFFFVLKNSYCKNQDYASDSGISGSWGGLPSDDDSSETTPLILSTVSTGYKMYTEEKLQYYEKSRKHENEMGETDANQITDIRGTMSITGKGSCEV